MDIRVVFSILFTMATIIYALVGVHILSLKEKTQVHYTCVALCLSLFIWSSAFAIQYSTLNHSVAVMSVRMAAIGYGSSMSIFVHFILLLTKQTKLLENRYIIPLIYIPAVINIVGFTIGPSFNIFTPKLVPYFHGWISTSTGSFFDVFFYIHTFLYIIITFIILIRWRAISLDNNIRKQFRLTIFVLIVTAVVSLVMDMILTDLFGIISPEITTIVALFPLGALVYTADKNNLIKFSINNNDVKILHSKMKDLLYKYIAYGFIIGGTLGFISKYSISNEELLESLIYAVLITSLGIIISIVIKHQKEESIKDYLVLLIIVMVVPIVIISGAKNGSVNIWVVPMIIAIPFMAYADNKMLIGLTISTLITLFVTSVAYTNVTTVIDSKDYTLRIFFMSISLALAFLVNYIYRNRLYENHRQMEMEKLIHEVSSHLATTSVANFGKSLTYVLEKLAKAFDMDRCYYLTYHNDGIGVAFTYEWCKPHLTSKSGMYDLILSQNHPWWNKQIRTNELIYISDISTLSNEAQTLMPILEDMGIISIAAVPVKVNDKKVGIVGMGSTKAKKSEYNEILSTLRIVSNVIGESYVRSIAEDTIYNMAYYDQLTGLSNRQLFMSELDKIINGNIHADEKAMISIIDLDCFKNINDTLGHDKGDILLCEVARRLKNTVCDTNTVCRFGGDEFLILTPGIRTELEIEENAQNILSVFENDFLVDGYNFKVTASMGIAMYPDNEVEADKLIKSADIAMYYVKEKGKNAYMLSTEILKEKINYQTELTNDLYKALDSGEIHMVYQPQVELDTEKIVGFEALIRWKHPKYGFIAPPDFISIAEKNGFIISLGYWIFEEVFIEINKWNQMNCMDFRIAINISSIQLKQLDFDQKLNDLMKQYDISPNQIELEVTETIALTDKQEIINMLIKLKALNISIAIDDFGTEFSSLGRLRDMPVDKIKIPKPFIDGINLNPKDEAIISSIIVLAHNLNLKTVIEGVEKKNQLEFLLRQNADIIQGYYYYKPLSSSEVSMLIDF